MQEGKREKELVVGRKFGVGNSLGGSFRGISWLLQHSILSPKYNISMTGGIVSA
jgi:hypothetical protein